MKLGIKIKLILSIVISTVIIFSAIIGYISLNNKNRQLEKTFKFIDEQAKSNASLVQSIINTDFGVVKTMALTFENYNSFSKNRRVNIFRDILINILDNNPEYLATYCQFELSILDERFRNNEGRVRTVYYNDGAELILQQDTVDRYGVEKETAYHLTKRTGLSSIENPYEFVYKTGVKVLETSISYPITNDGQFAGIAGLDISLERFIAIIDPISPMEGSSAFLIANNGDLVTYPDTSFIGKSIQLVEQNVEEYNLTEEIKAGRQFSYIDKHILDEQYHTFIPINIGNTQTPWSLCIRVPMKIITSEINNSFRRTIVLGIIGFIILVFIVWYISRRISNPIIKITQSLDNLAKGNFINFQKITCKSKDEIGEMVTALNHLSDNLKTSADFAVDIGSGDFTAEYKLKSEDDEFGKALILMRDNLQNLDNINNDQVWLNKGYNDLNIKIRGEQSIKKLSDNIIGYLCKNTEMQAGVLYVYNEKSKFLELTGTYAYSSKKKTKYKAGEGLVGQAAIDKKLFIVGDIPEGSFEIVSALGKTTPVNLLIAPFLFEDKLMGVLEMGSIKEITPLNLSFINNVLEIIGVAINSAQIKEKLKSLT